MLTDELTDFEKGFQEGCRVCAVTIRQAADLGLSKGLHDKVSADFLKEIADTMDPKKPDTKPPCMEPDRCDGSSCVRDIACND